MNAITNTDLSDITAPPPMAPPPKASRDSSFFGSFWIEETELALSVNVIREVVREPAKYEPIPRSPDYLLGLFDLRGMIIPVIDPAVILNIDCTPSPKTDRKIAIVEYGSQLLGLRFDRSGDVLNGKELDRTNFNRGGRAVNETIVDGVFKLGDDGRLILILDPKEIFEIAQIPCVEFDIADKKKENTRSKRKQCISFRIADTTFGFDMLAIREIVEFDKVDSTALTAGSTLGSINLRGDVVPLVDFQSFLKINSEDPGDEPPAGPHKSIVMQIGDDLISLRVDEIENIISYFENDMMPFPSLGPGRSDMFKGCLMDNKDRMVLLFDHKKLLADKELKSINTTVPRMVDDRARGAKSGKRHKNSALKTYITFSIGREFATEIKHVNEVLSYPENCINPPDMPEFVDGVVNIREELIPMLNLRRLFGMEDKNPRKSKVIIFSSDGGKCGIVVDSVDSILTLPENETLSMPQVGAEKKNPEMSKNVTDTLLVKNDSGPDKTLMVLDLARLSKSIR